jgi:muramoyltetrapeptide carboxypeptidase
MIRPPYLQQGDTIGIVPPAKSVKNDYIEKSIGIIRRWGFNVKLSGNINQSYHQFAGNDNQRQNALQEFLDDNNIKAVLCARGGYGTTRILDQLSFQKFITSPKWVIGYSDITAILLKINRMETECIHGPMPISMDPVNDADSLEYLRGLITGEINPSYRFSPSPLNSSGTAEGEIIGGNITMLCSSIGTESDFNTDGKILFIEEIDEYLYRIDRMMVQLRRAGKLQGLSGLVVGHMTNIKDNDDPFGKSAYEIIIEHISQYRYPVCFGAEIGHEKPNYPIPVGRHSYLNISNESAVLSFKK